MMVITNRHDIQIKERLNELTETTAVFTLSILIRVYLIENKLLQQMSIE